LLLLIGTGIGCADWLLTVMAADVGSAALPF